MMNKKKLAILGCTGSIGTQALQVVRHLGNYQVCALTANRNIDLLEQQAREFQVPMVAVGQEELANELRLRLQDTNTQVLSGPEGIVDCAAHSGADLVLNSIIGIAGLVPTHEALQQGIDIALANKETLVAGGDIIMSLAAEKGCQMLPVDSEHSAIFQCLQGCHEKKELKKILLTASGGPFYGWTKDQLKDVTVAQALKHPNWSMGAKITIDSATLMNKGLELIEAMHLFGVKPEQVEIVVQRESIIHSMVQFQDNSIIAQLSMPDMAHPIQYALTYPARLPGETPEVDFAALGSISFGKADVDTFRCLGLAIEAAKRGGSLPCVLNGANEAAVALFLKGEITFLQIGQLVEEVMARHSVVEHPTLQQVLECDRWAREELQKLRT
jgi:1-deoxy-D-xylulose-5-phosphate reductoisomerase